MNCYPNHSVHIIRISVNPLFSGQEQEALQAFIAKSVTTGTLKRYKPGWDKWLLYLSERGSSDPYPQAYREDEKVRLLCNLFRTRHAAGKRGKAAYSLGAAIRKYYQINLQSIAFFEAPLATAARTACRLTTDELRGAQRSVKGNDKLPVFVRCSLS
jgi:hypothetical protein